MERQDQYAFTNGSAASKHRTIDYSDKKRKMRKVRHSLYAHLPVQPLGACDLNVVNTTIQSGLAIGFLGLNDDLHEWVLLSAGFMLNTLLMEHMSNYNMSQKNETESQNMILLSSIMEKRKVKVSFSLHFPKCELVHSNSVLMNTAVQQNGFISLLDLNDDFHVLAPPFNVYFTLMLVHMDEY